MTGLQATVFAIPGDLDTVTGGYIYEKRLLRHLRAQGREVRHLELPASFPTPTDADLKASLSALQEVGPDTPIILDGFVSGGFDPTLLGELRAPTVAMVHHPLAMETGLDAALKKHLFETERANLKLVHHVLVPSPHTKSLLAGAYDVPENKITIATPGTDPPRFEQNASDPPLILTIGLHHPRKGHAVLLEALGRVKDCDWRACILGRIHDTASYDALLVLRRELGLTDRVEVQGQVTGLALDNLWAQAQIFALASEFEGYGMVFAEALVRGLPIIGCSAGAIPDTVPASAGLLVPPNDPDAFASALRQLLEDPALRAQKALAARTAGSGLPSWDDTARIAGDVIDQL